MTRVLHIFSDEFAGVARQVKLLMSHAPEKGYDWQSIVTTRQAATSPAISFPHQRVRNIPIFSAWDIARRIRRIDPQIVHIWLPRVDRTLGVWAACAAGRPVLVSVQHGAAAGWNGRKVRSPAPRFLASSPAVCESLRQRGAGKVQLVRWAVPIAEPPLPLPTSEELPNPTIMTSGRLTRDKQLKDLIWATTMLEQVGEVRFLVAGQGPLRDQLESYRDQVNVFRSTRFLGHVSDSHRMAGNAVCFWSASRQAGQSVSLTEAMAAGAAVVAVDTPTNRELIDHGKSGILVPPGGSVSFARHTRRLARNPELRAEMGHAAKASIGKRCGVDAMVASVLGHYDDVLRQDS